MNLLENLVKKCYSIKNKKMKKIKLYHGTNSENLKGILKEGIKPRNKKTKGNWEKIPSREGFVYLSDTYAGYYAVCSIKNKVLKPILIEVEVEAEKLYPDEDFIGQILIRKSGKNIFDITNSVDIENYKDLWKESLEKLGNASFKGTIPVKNIRRVKEIPSSLYLYFLDPSISLLNHYYCGQKYKELIKFVMGDIKEDPLKKEIENFYSQLKNQE